jgi:hypothetical protein
MIVFGWYAFLIRFFTQEQLQIVLQNFEGAQFEVRQKVLHVFWIPIFPVGKQYIMRLNGQKHEMPGTVISAIKDYEDVRTPWYSFALPILAVLAYVFFMFNIEWENYQHHIRQEVKFDKNVARLAHDLNNLTDNHFIKIVDYHNPYSSSDFYLDVIKVQNDLVYCFEVKTGQKGDYANMVFLLESYSATFNTDTIKIPIEKLKKAYYKDYNTYRNSEFVGQQLFNKAYDDHFYYLDKIEFLDGLMISRSSIRTMDMLRETVYIRVATVGNPVQLVAVKNIENNIDWKNLPLKPVKNFFRIKGKNYNMKNFKVELSFEDEAKKRYRFVFTKEGHRNDIVRITD